MAVDTGGAPAVLPCGLLARPLRQSDSESLRLLRNQDAVRRWFRDSEPVSADDQEPWVEHALARHGDYMWVGVDAAATVFAAVGLYNFDEDLGAAEVGRVMADQQTRRYRGSGRELLAYALSAAARLGLSSVYLYVKDTNDHALTLYRAMGFIESDRRREQGMYHLERGLS